MYSYVFRHASRYGAATWHGDRRQAPEALEHIFKETPWKVKGHWEVKFSKKCPIYQLWSEEPLTRVLCIDGVKGHVGLSRGQPEVKLLKNAPWLPNLVGRTPNQSVMHCWGQMSCRGQPGSTSIQIAQTALWSPNLVGRTPDFSLMHCWGQKSCKGQPGLTRGQIA